jgi:hypothetical protein
MKAFRTVLHGACLLGGKHPPGSALARECPVLNAQGRSVARRRGWLTRKAREGGPAQDAARRSMGKLQEGEERRGGDA